MQYLIYSHACTHALTNHTIHYMVYAGALYAWRCWAHYMPFTALDTPLRGVTLAIFWHPHVNKQFANRIQTKIPNSSPSTHATDSTHHLCTPVSALPAAMQLTPNHPPLELQHNYNDTSIQLQHNCNTYFYDNSVDVIATTYNCNTIATTVCMTTVSMQLQHMLHISPWPQWLWKCNLITAQWPLHNCNHTMPLQHHDVAYCNIMILK
jgi:hypothetical protein